MANFLQGLVELSHLLLLMSYSHKLICTIPPEGERQRESLVHVVLKFLVEFGGAASLDVLL